MMQGNGTANPQAQITSTLCKQCGQKPKFQNFEFCGKNCANTWQLARGGSNGNPNPPLLGGSLTGQAMGSIQVPNQLLNGIPPPLQAQIQAVLPTLVAVLQQQGPNQPQQQQQPPLNANLNVNGATPAPPSNTPQQPKTATTPAPGKSNANPPQQTNVNQGTNGGSGPGFPVPQNVQGPINGTNNTATPGQVQAAIVPTTCSFAGCTKPVYTDPTSNHPSEYCSRRHREEAVSSGQAKPCIMCLKMPRSSTDHFCSKVCRDAALS